MYTNAWRWLGLLENRAAGFVGDDGERVKKDDRFIADCKDALGR